MIAVVPPRHCRCGEETLKDGETLRTASGLHGVVACIGNQLDSLPSAETREVRYICTTCRNEVDCSRKHTRPDGSCVMRGATFDDPTTPCVCTRRFQSPETPQATPSHASRPVPADQTNPVDGAGATFQSTAAEEMKNSELSGRGADSRTSAPPHVCKYCGCELPPGRTACRHCAEDGDAPRICITTAPDDDTAIRKDQWLGPDGLVVGGGGAWEIGGAGAILVGRDGEPCPHKADALCTIPFNRFHEHTLMSLSLRDENGDAYSRTVHHAMARFHRKFHQKINQPPASTATDLHPPSLTPSSADTPDEVAAPSPTASDAGSGEQVRQNRITDSEAVIRAILERATRKLAYAEAIGDVMAVVAVHGSISLKALLTLLTAHGLDLPLQERIAAALKAMPAKGEA